ncbi:MAG: HDOD domain-containing protein [Planctomycetes bacterium]|nr:HDOD domain-containing protein [Planctomycetota bacterium]MCB9884927.1 HDOD domain-containing protein [Planctomycetota bacterium]
MSHSTLQQLAQQEKTRREILHKSDLIPPLPDLVVRLLAVLNNQETEPEDLEKLLQNDQVLVAKMLAMVNSPFYGMNRSIRTVKDAVMVLGFRGVRSLVLATSTAKFMQRDFACYGHEPKGLWLHAACVASGSKALARSCRLGADAAEQLFVAGLLHDIGKLMLLPYVHDNKTIAAARDREAAERAAIGMDHTEAGALVTAKWNLSLEIQEVLKSHHDRDESVSSPGLAVVRLADQVAHEMGVGYLPEHAPIARVLPGDLAVLGVAEAAWGTLRDEIAATMDEAVQALGSLAC